MMSGGTNLPVLGDLCRGSQTPYPSDAYPLLFLAMGSGKARGEVSP